MPKGIDPRLRAQMGIGAGLEIVVTAIVIARMGVLKAGLTRHTRLAVLALTTALTTPTAPAAIAASALIATVAV